MTDCEASRLVAVSIRYILRPTLWDIVGPVFKVASSFTAFLSIVAAMRMYYWEAEGIAMTVAAAALWLVIPYALLSAALLPYIAYRYLRPIEFTRQGITRRNAVLLGRTIIWSQITSATIDLSGRVPRVSVEAKDRSRSFQFSLRRKSKVPLLRTLEDLALKDHPVYAAVLSAP